MEENRIKMFVGVNVPIYACNFRCTYCYLGQYNGAYDGKIVRFNEKIDRFINVFTPDRIGGYCYFNFCGFGETLLHPDVIELANKLIDQGHFVDIITNGTSKNQLEKLCNIVPEQSRYRLIVKFSFHFLELKKRGLLDKFADNVNMIRKAGFSISVEVTPHDELIKYIPEIKKFSMTNFSALPHVTVARNEGKRNIELLSKYSKEELSRIWGDEFDSELFNYKLNVFGKKRNEYCYAGVWSIQINPADGNYWQCYIGNVLGNIYKDKKLQLCPIGRCKEPHCFNAHAFLTFGNIPGLDAPAYLNMRDRIDTEGEHWIKEKAHDFLSSRLSESNEEFSKIQKIQSILKNFILVNRNTVRKVIKRIYRATRENYKTNAESGK